MLRRLMLVALLPLLSGAVLADDNVRQTQQQLIDLGYDPGPADGAMGRKTREAILEFELATGVAVEWWAPGDLKARGDELKERQTQTSRTQLIVQGAGGSDFLLSSDEKLYVVEDSLRVMAYQVGSGRRLAPFPSVSKSIVAMAFSPDAKLMAVLTGDKFITLYDVETHAVVRRLRASIKNINANEHTTFYGGALAFSPDGLYLAAGDSDYDLLLFDVATGALARTFVPRSNKVAYTASISFSRNGSSVTWDGDDQVYVGDVATGKIVRELKVKSDVVRHVRFAGEDDDLLVVVAGENDNTIFDIASGKVLQRFALDTDASALAVSHDGKRMATMHRGPKIVLWEVATATEIQRVTSHWSGSLYFGKDDKELIFYNGQLRRWDLASNTIVSAPVQRVIAPRELRFDASGRTVVSDVGGQIVEWDVATGQAAASGTLVDPASPRRRVFSSDWALWARSNNESLEIVERRTGAVLHALERPSGSLSEFAFSPDDSAFAVRDTNDVVHVWDVQSGEKLHEFSPPNDNAPFRLAFSPLATTVTLMGIHGIWNWDWRTGKRLKDFKGVDVNVYGTNYGAGAYSPDGKLFIAAEYQSGNSGGVIAAWDVASRSRVWKQQRVGNAEAIRFTESGDYFTLVGREGRIQVYRTSDGAEILGSVLSGDIDHAVVSEDAKRLAVVVDGGISLFDVPAGNLLGQFASVDGGDWVSTTREGFFNASPKGSAALNIVRGTEAYQIGQAYQALYRPDLVAEALRGDPDGKVAEAAAKLDLEKVSGSGTAPRVLIAELVDGTTSDSDSIEVAASITDLGGGIGKIEWRVNGITLGIDARGFDRLSVDQQVADASGSGAAAPVPVRVSQRLSLDPGENVIEVVAYNSKGLIASDPARVTVNWDGVSASTPPRLYVLSVGVNDYYDGRLQLTYAASDAKAIGTAFKSAGTNLYESVEVTTVLDADVTAKNLDAVFADLGTKVRPRDVFVLFMAGHGKTQDGRYYFLPHDFRYVDETSFAMGGIDQDQFQEWLALIPARKSMLLYDTCDSGSLTNGVASRGLEEIAAHARMTRAMGRTVLSASTDDAPALEGYNGHGVFTYALLQAIGEGDTNGDGTIEVTELAGAIDRQVPELSYAAFNLRQIPQMSIVGSDFPIASQIQVLSAAVTGLAAEPEIPPAPSHFLAVAATIRAKPDVTSGGSVVLPAGSAISVVQTEGDWALVARDGTSLGYVPNASLLLIQ